jgi:cobalt-zinc-cadmium resistance protein CzcA
MGTNTAANNKLYHGFQVGVGVPLFKAAQNSNIKVAELETKIIEQEALNYERSLTAKFQTLQTQLDKYAKAIQFYETDGRLLSQEIINTANVSFQNGEIDYLQYLQALESAKNIEQNYLDNLIAYNLTVLEMNFLSN